MTPPQELTQLLMDWKAGSPEALEKLMPMVERELRRIAANYMRRENRGHTLQTTALVNEAFIKLVGQRKKDWQNRAHFFAVASQLMRRVLVDHARAQHRFKRGGEVLRVDLGAAEGAIVAPQKCEEFIALDEALAQLAQVFPRKSRVVEMRYFGGLKVEEIAEVLGISTETVRKDWRFAKAFIQDQMHGTQK